MGEQEPQHPLIRSRRDHLLSPLFGNLGEKESARTPKPSATLRPGDIREVGAPKDASELIKCALRRPVAAVQALSPSLSVPARGGSPHHFSWSAFTPFALDGTPVQAVSSGFTAISQLRNPVSRERAKLSKASCPALPARPRTPALSPDSSVCTPGLSMTGRHEFTTGQKGGDKYFEIFFAPQFPRPSRMLARGRAKLSKASCPA